MPDGLRIEVAGPNGRRVGLVTWPHVDNLLRPGATPARRQIVTRAWQVNVSFMGANDSFRAVGEGSLAAAAENELRALAATAVGAILEAVHPAGRMRPLQSADEAAMTRRIAALAAALPARPRRPRTPVGRVTTGDVIGHHSYRFHPILVTEPPRQAGAAVEITGRLTEPESGEPAGPFTLTVPLAGRQGAVVTVIPVPARSLRPLFPGHGSAARASQPAAALPGPAESTGTPSVLVTPPAGELLHARGDGPPDETDAAAARALDQAAAEAQACARWYRDVPEWQRTITVGRAARDLVTAIRDAAGDYWAEIRQDIRVRGFARTLAAWGLHRATTTFASRVMRYTPPGSPDRVADARRIVEDLRQSQHSPAQPGPGRHAAPRAGGETRAPNAAALAGTSFPVTVSRDSLRQAAAPPAPDP